MKHSLTCIAILLAAPSCGTVPDLLDAPGADATAAIDGAPPACDPRGRFDLLVPLTGLEILSVALTPRLLADERTLYFSGALAGESYTDLYVATRVTPRGPFTAPRKLAISVAADAEYNPTLSSDELTLLFQSNHGGGAYRLDVATRTSPLVEFGAPAPMGGVGSPVATDNDVSPFLTSDGQELWFSSDRAGGDGGHDIWRATRSGSSFATAIHVPGLGSASHDHDATVSADRLTVYFVSERAGGAGGSDVWVAYRASVDDAFSTPTPVAEVNSAGVEAVGWLSSDDCRLYLHSNRTGPFRLYVAERH